MDNQSNCYAWLFDSNLKLTYDMFSWNTGRLNNKGILNIFQNLKTLVKELSLPCTNTDVISSDTQSINNKETNLTAKNSDFFRL